MRPRLPCIPFLRRFAAFTPRAPSQTVRGNMRRVIVLEPGGEIFQEAVFVLRDDYLPSGISRQELLRQAKIAAEGSARVLFMKKRIPGMVPILLDGVKPGLYELEEDGSINIRNEKGQFQNINTKFLNN